MSRYMVIVRHDHGVDQWEVKARNPYVARELALARSEAEHKVVLEPPQVFEQMDPKAEAQRDAGRAAAFNEFYRDDVITLH